MRILVACCLLLVSQPAAFASFDALLHAARTKDFDAVRQLLEAGSDPDPPYESYRGYTPLMFAARYGHAGTVRLLLEAGAGTERRDHNGERALEWATRAYYLYRFGDVPGAVRLLLGAGSPADSDGDRHGISPLMHASQYGGDAALLRLLLDAGADPNRTTTSGGSALHRAAVRDGPAMAMLLEAGADPDAVYRPLGQTPLHVAASGGAVANARLLLAAGAETEPRYYRGRTALFIAAHGGADGVVAALIDAGADVDAADDEGRTPVLAAIRGRSSVTHERRAAAVTALAAHTSDLDRAFAAAVDGAFDGAASLLLERGASVDSIDERGRSAFAAAAARAESGWFARLLELDVDLGRHGAEALGAAAGAGVDGHVERLLERGLDVDARDGIGATALMRAAAQGRVGTVELLLGRGADPMARDDRASGPVDYMAAARAPYEAAIAHAEGARAMIDVSAERAELARLLEAHAVIETMLGL